jgi:hypothetical protein
MCPRRYASTRTAPLLRHRDLTATGSNLSDAALAQGPGGISRQVFWMMPAEP